jgi:hypothetical protein
MMSNPLRRAAADSSNVGQSMHRVGKSLHHANQQRHLSIWFRSPLLPILEGSNVGAQIPCEEPTRKIQILSNSRELAGRYRRSRLCLDGMCAQRSRASTLLGERVKTLSQLAKQVTLFFS